MTETPFQRNIRFVRAMIESNQGLIAARHEMIDNMVAMAPEIERARQRLLEMATAQSDMRYLHELASNAAANMETSASMASKFLAIERSAETFGVKWAQPPAETIALLDEKFASISRVSGFNLGLPLIDKLLETTKEYEEELPSTVEQEAEVDALLELNSPGLTAEIEKLYPLVDFSDPKHRRAVVWSVKIFFYMLMLYIITVAGGADTVELSDFLNNMGVSPMKIADFSGEWVGAKMDKSGHADDEESEH